jgi:hypothetical protein
MRSTAAADAAAAGRARMSKNDCEHAVESFDIALRTDHDATVMRDRGICHEKLGHTFPAIEDYRAYLFRMPDAADADNIKERLAALEQASQSDASHTDGLLAPDWSNQAGIMNQRGLRGNSSSTQTTFSNHTRDQVDELEEEERLDGDARNSPLRRGTGLSFGPYFQYRTWGVSGAPIGTGYGVGASIRESLGQVSTLLLEVGYVSYGTDSGQATSANVSGVLPLGSQRQGVGLTLAYEARIRFDPRATNALIIAVGPELNTLTYAQTKDSFTTILARGRLGLRHVFGPALGVEVAFDIAQPIFGTGSALTAAVGTSTLWQTTVMGGYAGLTLGF